MGLFIVLLIGAPALDAAEAALKEFDAEGTLEALERTKKSGPLNLEAHIRFYEYAGIAHAYLEHNEESLAAFLRLLMLSPGHAIAYTLSPQVTFLFQEARARASSRPTLAFSWPQDRQVDQSLPVVVEVLSDPRAQYAYALLFWRDSNAGPFSSIRVALPKPGQYIEARIPPPNLARTADLKRQIYLSAFDALDNELTRLGDPKRPRQVLLRYIPPTPWYERWWLWASIGTAVAAGTATAVYFGTRSDPDEVPFDVNINVLAP